MHKLTKLITLDDKAQRDTVAEALRALAAQHRPHRTLVAPTLEGSWLGGDLLAHFQFGSEADRAAFDSAATSLLAAPAVASIDSITYRGAADGVRAPGLANGVYRALLLCVDDTADAATIARFEGETRRMPNHIPAIRNWQLSRVESGTGSRAWTHVWEQEYADIGGLRGPYMLHPYHWAHIDRWFDPECPDRIVDTRICHSFCAAAEGVLSL